MALLLSRGLKNPFDDFKRNQAEADKKAFEAFGAAVKQAGASTGEKKDMWANNNFEDLVKYNNGFKAKLTGTKDQAVDRIPLLKSSGIDIILLSFLHYKEDIDPIGKEVLPLVRKLESEGRGREGQP